MALQNTPRNEPIHILTDSLESIYMISNKIYKSTTQFGHSQADLLQDIVQLLHDRGEQGGTEKWEREGGTKRKERVLDAVPAAKSWKLG